jgi:hypothetical protein
MHKASAAKTCFFPDHKRFFADCNGINARGAISCRDKDGVCGMRWRGKPSFQRFMDVALA